jgi:hypothetical protein
MGRARIAGLCFWFVLFHVPLWIAGSFRALRRAIRTMDDGDFEISDSDGESLTLDAEDFDAVGDGADFELGRSPQAVSMALAVPGPVLGVSQHAARLAARSSRLAFHVSPP